MFVKGIPKLADTGLVTEMSDKTGSYAGTEGFIPPEGPGTAQADLSLTVYNRDKAQYDIKAIAKAQLDADEADLRNKKALVAQQAASGGFGHFARKGASRT